MKKLSEFEKNVSFSGRDQSVHTGRFGADSDILQTRGRANRG